MNSQWRPAKCPTSSTSDSSSGSCKRSRAHVSRARSSTFALTGDTCGNCWKPASLCFLNSKILSCGSSPTVVKEVFIDRDIRLICVFKKGKAPHANSFELGQHGRSRTNVWSYAGVNSFKRNRREELDSHPTVKPVRLVADAMLDCSRRGSIVLDPFMGSGTSIIAGQMVGRRVYGMELEPRYVDVAVRRWERFSGRDSVPGSSGQTFGEAEAARREGGGPPARKSGRGRDDTQPVFSAPTARVCGRQRRPPKETQFKPDQQSVTLSDRPKGVKMPPPWQSRA